MQLGRYQLLTQIGAGKDGTAYRSQDVAAGSFVQILLLNAARAEPERWRLLARRLQVASLLQHPAAAPIRELYLEHDPPFVVLPWAETENWADSLRQRLPLASAETLTLGEQLADVLAAAHRVGLAHGHVGPGALQRTSADLLLLDFTGCDCGTFLADDAVAEVESACRAPGPAGFAADVYALGVLLFWWLTNRRPAGKMDGHPLRLEIVDPTLAGLLRPLLAEAPEDRPPAAEVAGRLRALRVPVTPTRIAVSPGTGILQGGDSAWSNTVAGAALDDAPPERQAAGTLLLRQTLGRYRLMELLGEGGMGTVYRAEDPADGAVVAIKVLRPEGVNRPQALRRFLKEARLLAELNNPCVTNLLEVNEDAGVHYLVMEYVAGRSLDQLLEERGRLEEATALAIVADVARALVEAHERGIVHRDVKPANVLLMEPAPPAVGFRVKLADFGLARHIEQSESLHLTRTGTVMGTPLYMAPEQSSGKDVVDARADVYALGATLFHLLAGRPPFLADSAYALTMLHWKEPPPPLQKLNPELSEGVCRVVEKCLAKAPAERYANAGALLEDLERLRRGEPTSIVVHPLLPDCDPAKVLHYDWTWELEASPEQLWPHVSNTERLNRAVGLPAVQFTNQADPEGGTRRFGRFRKAGITAAWEEHPFEWVEGRRLGVLREYHEGPFKWFAAIVELAPRAGGGTLLTARVRIAPHGLLGRTAAAVEVGMRSRRALERVYRRIDATLMGKLGSRGTLDPFEAPVPLSRSRRRRLDSLLEKLDERGIDSVVVERLGDYLAEAPAQAVARIRPLALARRLALDPDQVVAACLHGSREGLFVLLWDLLCPVCRIPSEVRNTLKALQSHGRCDACNLDYELDFANSVEMIFRAHPEIRDTDLGTYCVGGPAHSPHVAAQVRVGPGERLELELPLTEGAYRLRGPQLPFTFAFRVQAEAAAGRVELNLRAGPGAQLPHVLKADQQLFVLTNETRQELVVRVERAAQRDDALTAARASALALFRELFAGEVLSPGQLVSVAHVTLLVTDLEGASNLYDELGDAQAFGLLHEHFRLLEERVRLEGGALVKTVGEGVLAVFAEPLAAVRAALELQAVLAGGASTGGLRLRVGVHRGPAMAATLNDHLDYFGATVRQAAQLLDLVRGGDVALTQTVAADPQVAALLAGRGLQAEVLPVQLPGASAGIVQRVCPGRAD